MLTPPFLLTTNLTCKQIVTSTDNIPSSSDVMIKICKGWGWLCYTLVEQLDMNLCEAIGIGDENNSTKNDNNNKEDYCAVAGTYNYQSTFVLPDSQLMDYLWDDFTFRLYIVTSTAVAVAVIADDDNSSAGNAEEVICYAQFKTFSNTGNISSATAVAASTIGIGAFISIIVVAAVIIRKRKIRQQQQEGVEPMLDEVYATDDIELC